MANRPRRFLLYSFAAVVPAIGLLAGTAAVASARTITAPAATHSAAAEAKAIAVAEIKKLTVGYHPTDHRVGITSPGFKGLSDVTSTNWSGYADTGSSFSDVSASWTEPGATCSSRTTSLAAFWVGIDGYSSDSVEQDGTLIECYDRTAYQFTWWEMYPTNDVQVVGETAAAGDAITASVVGAAPATSSPSPTPPTPPTASPPPRPAPPRAAWTAAPSGSRRPRRDQAGSSR